MYEQFMKKLGKKGKKLEPNEKEAKMNVVKELSKQAGDMLGDKVKGLKKVSVASDSKEGLKAGLSKAEQIVEGAEEDMGLDLDKDNEEGESEEHKKAVYGEKEPNMAEECKDMSAEEIEKQIQALEDLKKEKLSQKE